MALAVGLLIVVVIGAILRAAADHPAAYSSRIDLWHLLRMTTIQAGLTTLISLAVGIALAWALNRLRFPGRDLIVGLFASAIVTPGIVVAFGLLAVWGRSGWASDLWQALTGEALNVPIFGLAGILAAHVILDGTFAARVLLARLDTVPERRLKTGQSLDLTAWQRFTIIDWSMLRGALPGLGAIIFMLAFTSFPIVLLLGGGPANQTLEVAIYTAASLDFDLTGAVRLAMTQIAVCSAIILASAAFSPVSATIGRSPPTRWRDRPLARALQWLVLVVATIGFVAPLLAVLADGIGPHVLELVTRDSFRLSLLTSLAIGSASACLTLVLALIVGLGRAAAPGRVARIIFGAPAYAYLAVPAVVLALGFFLFVRELGIAPTLAAPVIVVIANALLSLPFALATLGPPLDAIVRSRGRLVRALGLSSWRQFVDVEYPLIGRDIGLVIALGFCFSLGDLGVIALFGTQDFQTLPLLMYRALGGYRSNDAATIAALLLILTIAAFILLPRLFTRSTNAPA